MAGVKHCQFLPLPERPPLFFPAQLRRLAIAGVADQFVFDRIPPEAYNTQVDLLKDEVPRFNVEHDRDLRMTMSRE